MEGRNELDLHRVAVDRAAEAGRILLGPADPGWTVRGVPLAPFPARLRLDAAQSVLWHDVAVAEVVPPLALEQVVDGIALPRPEIRMMVGEARWIVAISYPLPFARITESETVGLLLAGALYAAALATELSGHLGKRWRSTLEEHGFVVGSGFAGDPRELLRNGRVVGWPDIGQ